MTWQALAHKDVRDAGRSKAVWLLTGLLALVFVGFAFAYSYLGDPTFGAFLDALAGLVAAVVPILALLLGYKSVAAERSSGSLYLTLSVPHSRRDVVVGKFVGRAVVLLVPTLGTLLVAGVVGAVRYGTEGFVSYPWFLFATALYGVAFVGIAVGLSVVTTADRRLTVGALGTYLFLVTFYDGFHTLTLLVLHRGQAQVLANLPDWALLFRLLKPGASYFRLLRLGFDVERAGGYVGSGTPFYVDWWMGLVVLAAWCVIPLALGYRQFRASDI